MSRKGIAPLKPAEYVRLCHRWGFVLERGNGGHLVMSYDDRRVQVTAPRRKALTPWKALREAAEVVGVDLQEFLQGPTKETAPSVQPDEIRVTQPCGCVIDEHGWIPCTEHKEPEVVAVEPERVTEVATEEEVATTRRRRTRSGGKRSPIVEVVAKRTSRKHEAPTGSGVEVPEDFEFDDLPDEIVARKPVGRSVATTTGAYTIGAEPESDEGPEPEQAAPVDATLRAERIINRILTEGGWEVGTHLQRSAYDAAVASVRLLIHTVEDTKADS